MHAPMCLGMSVYQPSLPIDLVVWSPGLSVKLLNLVLAPLLAIELSTQAARSLWGNTPQPGITEDQLCRISKTGEN